MLIQPNNITFGQYDLSEVQENVLTLIIDGLQKHVSKEKTLPRDVFNQPYVDIYCDEAKGKNSKHQVIAEVKKMFSKSFSFKWVHPGIHQTVESSGTIISTCHNIKNSNHLILNFNPWAIPFLLYYGNGVGGTRYHKTIALKLRGNYTKRLYKMICRWQDKPSFFYPIDRLRKDLFIPKSYDNNRIKTNILDKAKERIEESNSDIWFDYKFFCKNKKTGRKPKADTVIFIIKTKHPKEVGGVQFEMYSSCLYWMQQCFGFDGLAQEATDKLSEIGELKEFFERASYYDEKVCQGGMEKTHMQNSLKKMLRERWSISKENGVKKITVSEPVEIDFEPAETT